MEEEEDDEVYIQIEYDPCRALEHGNLFPFAWGSEARGRGL